MKEREYEIPIERAIFAMAANRALAPCSKLSVENWVSEQVYVPGLPVVPVHQLYKAMDFFLENDIKIQEDIFFSVATVINLEVDLIYFDTTSTYFETDPDLSKDNDEPNLTGLRQYGYSKDKRDDLPQVIIGMAVTKEGIPVRCWVFSGETSDVSIVEQVKKDLTGWKLGRVISVMDRGFVSAANCIALQRAGGHYIIGEKMRCGKPEVIKALSKAGRYSKLREDLFAKESIVGEGERRIRYVIVLNPNEAKKDKLTREKHLDRLSDKLAALDDLSDGQQHTKAVCALISHRTYGRYLHVLKNGRLEIDKSAVAREEKLDGKYLLRTSDDTLSIEDIVLGYKQLLIIERGFRTLKTELELRPVYHRKSERIRSHVFICWLALLLIRVAELETDNSWFNIKRELRKLSLVSLQLPDGFVNQTSESTAEQKNIFSKCSLKLPPKIISISE